MLSLILFVAVVEHAIDKRKQQLLDEGFTLVIDWIFSRLTNIQCANDLLLFGSVDKYAPFMDGSTSVYRPFIFLAMPMK